MQRKLLRRSGTCNYYRCNFFQRLQVPAHLVDVKTKCTMATYDHQKLKIQINEKNNRHEDEKITTAPATTVATSPAINNTNVITILEDNPCWGSPTRHRLEDLLFLIHRNTSIVFDSPNFLVLNKPADLRMDGPYPSTVHKLLTYWYPPPSLLHGCNKKNKNSTALSSINESTEGASKNDGREIKNHNTLLLELVSRLHQHNSIADNFLRPCHQLDYATSGVLLVAKTKEGAAQVGRLLEDRDEGVQKSYVAVVVGDLRTGLLCKDDRSDEKNNRSDKNPDCFCISNVPIWTGGQHIQHVRERLQKLEETYRRTRARAGKQHRREGNNKQQGGKSSFSGGTFQGFQPAHSIFMVWKSKLKLASKHGSPKMKRRKGNNKSTSALLTDEDWQRIWKPVREVEAAMTTATETAATTTGRGKVVAIDFLTLEWKKLGIKHPELKNAMIRASDIHNDTLRVAINKQEEEQEKASSEGSNHSDAEFPTFFRLSGSNCTQDVNNNSDNTFFIFCPLAQDPDQFSMIYKTGHDKDDDDDDDDDDKSQLDFKPSLTKCTVLEQGTLSRKRNNTETNIDVTKVLLHPITGRRHQLRVHMALTGSPVLGDVTYGNEEVATMIDDDHINQNKDECNNNNIRTIHACSRMCLHAKSLELPSLLGEKDPKWKITTPDPFEIGEDSMLKLNQDYRGK